MASRPVVPAFELPDLEPINHATDESVLELNENLRRLIQGQAEQRKFDDERARQETWRWRITTFLVCVGIVVTVIAAL